VLVIVILLQVLSHTAIENSGLKMPIHELIEVPNNKCGRSKQATANLSQKVSRPTMDNSDTLKMLIKEYRRKKRDAGDDVLKGQSQLFDHERKLESLKNYQKECREGFHSIPDSALFYAQRRECKLLLEHLDEVLHEQRECVSSCLKYIEKHKALVKQFNDRLQQCEQELEDSLLQGESPGSKRKGLFKAAGEKDNESYSWIKVDKKI